VVGWPFVGFDASSKRRGEWRNAVGGIDAIIGDLEILGDRLVFRPISSPWLTPLAAACWRCDGVRDHLPRRSGEVPNIILNAVLGLLRPPWPTDASLSRPSRRRSRLARQAERERRS
jgi:hypothetical protein